MWDDWCVIITGEHSVSGNEFYAIITSVNFCIATITSVNFDFEQNEICDGDVLNEYLAENFRERYCWVHTARTPAGTRRNSFHHRIWHLWSMLSVLIQPDTVRPTQLTNWQWLSPPTTDRPRQESHASSDVTTRARALTYVSPKLSHGTD